MSSVNVLETNVLHASDVLYWLDGSSAEAEAEMLRIDEPVSLLLSVKPRDLHVVEARGKSGLLRRPTNEIVRGRPSEADKQRPATATYTIAGTVSHRSGLYIPRAFSLVVGNGTGHGLVLYPSTLRIKLGSAGGLIGCLRFAATGDAAAWALLTLEVSTVTGTALTFRCQASGSGDFIMPLPRLPPLPEGIDSYGATLRVHALSSARADIPLDPATLIAMRLGELNAGSFSDAIALTLVPGEVRLLRSSTRNHLAVQPI